MRSIAPARFTHTLTLIPAGARGGRVQSRDFPFFLLAKRQERLYSVETLQIPVARGNRPCSAALLPG
jgi:hypothetical protein